MCYMNNVNEQHAIELLQDLVSTASPSGHEHEAVLLLVQRMSALGFRAGIDPAGNAVGVIGSEAPDATEILLLGHIDTVPGHIPIRVEDGALWGRGSVDAKGPLCAFAVAAATAKIAQDTRLVVIGAVGEETPSSPGASYARDHYRPDACLIGEPSGWERFAIGYKGRLIVRALFEQAAGHSAGPVGSVAEAAIEWHRRVTSSIAEWNIGHEGLFETIQPSLQAFNTNSDGLRDSASLILGLRLPTWAKPEDIEARIRRSSPDVSLSFQGHAAAHRGPRTGEVPSALSAAIGSLGGRPTATVKTGTSDMNTVATAFGCPIVAYGPGDSTLDHTPHERLDLPEYLRSIEVLRHAIPQIAAAFSPERCAS
ncbi:hypothetical protein AY599_00770 [Leptolyngbya valderiana BDU 20041]|nr:hypothetical protein AY599_00770 [Leptolyngbya valderiana BDU 20041]